eukprot:TRINITY_DN6093_c0_g1_i2.p1 TRINITY_DN6093_c0_g1~~TRINITY_DN6093_c0_g1_i2.p1  ORF type:complete len:345 (+),score=90.10 TRINITY_DN6093_c0_g1_i2:224-1258(+)
MRKTGVTLVTSFNTAVSYLPQRYQLDHSADQYGVQRHFPPQQYEGMEGTPTRGLTPSVDEPVYHPIKEPFLVPPKYRKLYNFQVGHGKFLYSKDPLWVEARERMWDDMQIAAQVHRKNYEHIRRQYRKQWQDAQRFNLDEYITTLNRVRKQEEIEREVSEQERQKGWEEDLARIDAITLLQEKRRRLRSERFWKLQVWNFERATEDLQYLVTHKVNQDYYTMENIDNKLEQECRRWVGRAHGALNMFGRIPYAEDEDGVPELEVQYTFQAEDLSEDGREAYRRLTQVADVSHTGRIITKHEASYADLDFGDDYGESELDTPTGTGEAHVADVQELNEDRGEPEE